MNDLTKINIQQPTQLQHFWGMIPDLFFKGIVARDEVDAKVQIRKKLIEMFDNDDVGLLIEKGDSPTG